MKYTFGVNTNILVPTFKQESSIDIGKLETSSVAHGTVQRFNHGLESCLGHTAMDVYIP